MAYTTINKPTDYFNTVLYTGDGTNSRTVTGVGHQPDLVWLKNRTGATAYHHQLHDSVRGATQGALYSSLTNAEDTTYGISSFDSDGFTLRNPSHDSQNGSGYTFAAWNWLAGGTASSNTDGSITSSVSANTTSGFSIVSYTANGTAGATIGHGLGAVPKVIITKDRSAASNWFMYHVGTDATAPETKYMELESTDAVQDFTVWNDTAPTSSVFTIGNAAGNNTSGNNIIAYCFSEVKGFSKFGSYTGNGSTDGTFVYTGFKPAFVLVKVSSSTSNWVIWDNKRDAYNVADALLLPNSSNAESGYAGEAIDLLSNGFKARYSAFPNNSGATLIYMAFAENPLVTSGGTPATAR